MFPVTESAGDVSVDVKVVGVAVAKDPFGWWLVCGFEFSVAIGDASSFICMLSS